MYYVYVIYSKTIDRYYVGCTADLFKRLNDHNSGISTFTSKASDWELAYSEPFESRELAHKRELEIKRKKSRKYIEWIISSKV